LQSLVNLTCLHCGESGTISNYAHLHQAVRRNIARCVEFSAKLVQRSSGAACSGHTCLSVWFVVAICIHAANCTYAVAFDHIMLTSYKQAHESRLAVK